MEIKLDLSQHGNIPKVIHMSWKNKNIFDNQSPVVLNGILNIKKLNPDYKLLLSDDNDVEVYLKKNLSFFDYYKIKYRKIVEKIDLWRLLKIYNEGGIYIDFDRYCNKSFDNIIKSNTKCILPTFLDFDFAQDIMISCPENPIYKKAIEYNLKERTLFPTNQIFHLGPVIFMRSVTEIVFGEIQERNPPIYKMEKYRELLNNSMFFQTYREHPKDNLIYEYDKETFLIGNGKERKEFYEEQNVKHWSVKKNLMSVKLYIFFLLIFLLRR